MGEHAAAGLDGDQLFGIADEHCFGSCGGGCGEQFAQCGGADHACFIDDKQGLGVEGEAVFAQCFERSGDGAAAVGSPLGQCDIGGVSGRRGQPNVLDAALFGGAAQGFQRGGFARAGRGGEHLNQPRRGRDRNDCPGLIGRQLDFRSGGLGDGFRHGGILVAGSDQRVDGGFFARDHQRGVALMAFTFVRLAGLGDAQTDRVDELLEQQSRADRWGVIDDGRHVRTECLDEISAGEGRLVDTPDRSPCPRPKLGLGVLPQPGQRLLLGGLVQDQFSTESLRPFGLQFSPGPVLGLARPGGFLGPRELSRGGLSAAVDDQILCSPLAQLGGSLRGRSDQFGVHSGKLGHPRMRIHLLPSDPQRGVQLSPQRGLVDDPGGPGFMPQRVTVDGHQRAIGAGLLVGHQHMGVQVRIPGPRGLVLVGRRDQTR